MNVIIPSTGGGYAGLHDTIASYRARSKCDVFVIADKSVIKHPDASFSDFDCGETGRKLVKAGRPYTLRWIVCSLFVKRIGLSGPLYIPDWDMLGFTDMVEACKPFADHDVGACHNQDGCWGGISYFTSTEHLHEYAEFIDETVRSAPDEDAIKTYNDMATGAWFVRDRKKSLADMAAIVNGSTFDGNIHCNVDQFETDIAEWNITKRLAWTNGIPHFILRSTKELIVANVIHCWGSYKNRTNELVRRAGIL